MAQDRAACKSLVLMPGTAGTGQLSSNCHNSPNSEKSAESLVEGMAPPFAGSHGMQAFIHQDSHNSMPDLPRIRVRSQASLTKVIRNQDRWQEGSLDGVE